MAFEPRSTTSPRSFPLSEHGLNHDNENMAVPPKGAAGELNNTTRMNKGGVMFGVGGMREGSDASPATRAKNMVSPRSFPAMSVSPTLSILSSFQNISAPGIEHVYRLFQLNDTYVERTV